jgi:uncharacterized protein
VKLVDTNVLVYALTPSDVHHESSRAWLGAAFSGRETVLLPWVSLVGFLRIVTHPRLYANPLRAEVALALVEDWLSLPHVVAPEPDDRHVARMAGALAATGRGGNLVNDAHLAALAIQYGAEVVTFDSDFGRFPGVRWITPA